MTGAAASIRHLYVHVPFCAHRCGHCDFVTLVGRTGQHGAYVDALLAELELERGLLGETVETVFLMPHEKYTYISSRLIKEVASFGESVAGLVPPIAGKRLAEKYPPKTPA